MKLMRITPLKRIKGYAALARYLAELDVTDRIMEIKSPTLPRSKYSYSDTQALEWSNTLGSWIHRAETAHMSYIIQAIELA